MATSSSPPGDLSSLPTELKLKIANFLHNSRDVAKLRLISKDWAVVGARYLFPDGFFHLRPHRPDMQKLKAAANHPEISRCIQHLDFFAGDMDRGQFERAIKQASECSTGHKLEIENLLSKIQPRIDSMLKTSSWGHCDKEVLERDIFPHLINVNSIAMVSTDFPFIGWEPLQLAWEFMFDNYESNNRVHCWNTKVSVQRYYNVISASLKLPCKIQKLLLPHFPLDCLLYSKEQLADIQLGQGGSSMEVNPLRVATIKASFENVIDMSIGFIGSSKWKYYSVLDLARAVGTLIGAAKQMESLVFEWVVDEASPEFLDTMHETICAQTFPELKAVRFESEEMTDKVLLPFLERHASTLKCFGLYADNFNIDEDSNWKLFLTALRDKLNLEKVDVMLDQEGSGDLYTDQWIELPQPEKSVPYPSKLLEMYILGKTIWPMHGDNPSERSGWKPRFIGKDLGFLTMSKEERDDLLGDVWETEGEESDGDGMSTDDTIDDDVDDMDLDLSSESGSEGEWEGVGHDDGEEWEDEHDDHEEVPEEDVHFEG